MLARRSDSITEAYETWTGTAAQPCDGVPRCHALITDEHLQRVAQLALQVFKGLFDRRPDTFCRYLGRLLMLALCRVPRSTGCTARVA